MAFEYGFYNSKNEDRLYDALQMSRNFDGLINDGVYATIGDCFIVKSVSGMDITIGTGRAWFNHTWNYNDALLPLTVDDAEVILNRIDAVVLEVDARAGYRTNTIKIVKGTPATNPEKPTLTNTDELHQHPLAYITVGADVSEISQSVIENAVGTSACPFVTGIIETIDIDALVLQWQAEWTEWKNGHTVQFEQWFNEIQDILDESTAGHLQNEITDINAALDAQGISLQNSVVSFPSDGTIVESYGSGSKKITSFPDSGDIVETLKNAADVTQYTITTSFPSDGTIVKTVTEQ